MNKKYRIETDLLHTSKLTNKIIKERVISKYSITESCSGTFYHYTSAEGLVGILRNRHLFFTDCQFLNDRAERLQINSELECFWRRNMDKYDKDFYKLLSGVKIAGFDDSEYYIIDDSEAPVKCRYFVFSSSRKADSLDMWKYYSKNGTYDGYFIDLNTYALTDEWIDRKTGISIEQGDVVYFDTEKQAKIEKQIEELYSIWCKYETSILLDQKILMEYKAWVSYASLFFKHESFAQEDEYRFIAVAPCEILNSASYEYEGQKISIYDFRNVYGTITPYLKMPFCTYNTEDCCAISHIGISPSQHSDLRIAGLNHFIKSLDYEFAEMRITQSNIPLRY